MLQILVHEMGHALAALLFARGPVDVIAGRSPGLVRLRLGRLRISWHPLPARGVDWGGLCVCRDPMDPTRQAMIHAAGPAADLVWAAVLTVALRRLGREFDPFELAMVILTIACGVSQTVCNFSPGLLRDPARAAADQRRGPVPPSPRRPAPEGEG
jgi:hypothetical protein